MKSETRELVLTSMFITLIVVLGLIPQIGYVTILPGVSLTLVHIPTMIGIFILKPKYGIWLGVAFGVTSLIAAYIYAVTPFDLAFQNPLISITPRVLFGLTAFFIFTGLKKLATVKNGNVYIFLVVTLVISIALFYGAQAITKNVTHNQYNIAVNAGESSEAELDDLLANAKARYEKALPIVQGVSIVVIALFITLFYALISNKSHEALVAASSFILGTVAHTILVLAAVILLSRDFNMIFRDAISVIYTIAASNGLIEALVAALIGTPIYFALKTVKNESIQQI